MFDLLGKNSERVWMPSSRPPYFYVRGLIDRALHFPATLSELQLLLMSGGGIELQKRTAVIRK